MHGVSQNEAVLFVSLLSLEYAQFGELLVSGLCYNDLNSGIVSQ